MTIFAPHPQAKKLTLGSIKDDLISKTCWFHFKLVQKLLADNKRKHQKEAILAENIYFQQQTCFVRFLDILKSIFEQYFFSIFCYFCAPPTCKKCPKITFFEKIGVPNHFFPLKYMFEFTLKQKKT